MAFQNNPKQPKFWGGFNAVGASGVRALHQVDDRIAPFLTKVNKGSVSYKRNGFDEVVLTGEVAPYLFGSYIVHSTTGGFDLVFPANCSPEDHLAKTMVAGVQINVGGTGGFNYSLNTYTPYVGDRYVLQAVMGDGNLNSSTRTWLLLQSVEGGKEYFPGTNRRGQTVSYIDSSVTGLAPRDLSYSVWVSGWDNDTTRYRYGFTTMVAQDSSTSTAALYSRAPVCVRGNTGNGLLASSGFPYYTARNHFDFYTFTVGRGKLQALVFADNVYYASATPNYTMAYAAPYLAYSNDHGGTWSTAAVAWLTPALCPGSFSPGVRNEQMQAMAKHTTITYIGNGKTLLYIPNAYVSGPELTAVYAPAIYLGTGTSYTRLSWPPDTWFTPFDGIPSSTANIVAFSLLKETRAGHHGFGNGCFYVRVQKDGLKKILYTHDYGSTWAYADIPATLGLVAGAVIAPYVSPTSPGRIIFASPDYAANKLSFYSVGGDFAQFKSLGPVIKAAGTLFQSSSEPYNYFFVNYGGLRYAPYVFPAYPKEFEKP